MHVVPHQIEILFLSDLQYLPQDHRLHVVWIFPIWEWYLYWHMHTHIHLFIILKNLIWNLIWMTRFIISTICYNRKHISFYMLFPRCMHGAFFKLDTSFIEKTYPMNVQIVYTPLHLQDNPQRCILCFKYPKPSSFLEGCRPMHEILDQSSMNVNTYLALLMEGWGMVTWGHCEPNTRERRPSMPSIDVNSCHQHELDGKVLLGFPLPKSWPTAHTFLMPIFAHNHATISYIFNWPKSPWGFH